MKIFGIVSMMLFVVSFLPQLIKTIKTKMYLGISIGLWVLVVLGHLTGLVYVISVGDLVLVLTYSIGLLLSGLEMVLVVVYKVRKHLTSQWRPFIM